MYVVVWFINIYRFVVQRASRGWLVAVAGETDARHERDKSKKVQTELKCTIKKEKGGRRKGSESKAYRNRGWNICLHREVTRYVGKYSSAKQSQEESKKQFKAEQVKKKKKLTGPQRSGYNDSALLQRLSIRKVFPPPPGHAPEWVYRDYYPSWRKPPGGHIYKTSRGKQQR